MIMTSTALADGAIGQRRIAYLCLATLLAPVFPGGQGGDVRWLCRHADDISAPADGRISANVGGMDGDHMLSQRTYGDAVAHSFGLTAAPRRATQSLKSTQIAVTKRNIGPSQLGLSPSIPAEDTFIVAVYMISVPDHELLSNGRSFIRIRQIRDFLPKMQVII